MICHSVVCVLRVGVFCWARGLGLKKGFGLWEGFLGWGFILCLVKGDMVLFGLYSMGFLCASFRL